jgi:DNA polymerase III epsilon subunit-like protein
MDAAVILDCEFLTADGALQRFWCGPFDPDPTVVQIGAVRLGLGAGFPILDRFEALVQPVDRHGAQVVPDPVFSRLTGITPDRIAAEGRSLGSALTAFSEYARDAMIWSWGKDELNLMAISPWIAGIAAPLPARRFGNACSLLLKAGVPYARVQSLRSHTLCAQFDLAAPEGAAHDARHDALSVARVLQYLLQAGLLLPADLASAP